MSEIRANTVSNAAGTGPVTLTGQYAAKAWANFNGAGTVAIRESGNVSSITDRGTGRYTVNFASSLTDANYVTTGYSNQQSIETGWGNYGWGLFSKTSSDFRFESYNYGSSVYFDSVICDVTVTR